MNNKKEDFQKKHKNHNYVQAQQNGSQARKSASDQPVNKERSYNKNNQKDNAISGKNNHVYQSSAAKHATKAKTAETVEDIRLDIGRIEKEIELEIKEIKSLRLGI